MAFNIGSFAGGLAQGWNQGMKMSEDYRRIKQRQELEEAAGNGLGEAQKQREADINNQVNYLAPDDGTAPAYRVGSQVFKSPDEAKAIASKEVGTEADYYAKIAVPKIAEIYMKRGDMANAESWTKWAENHKNQNAIKVYGKALTSYMSGDLDGAAKNFGKYYTDHIDDGVDYAGHSAVMGEDGKVSGFSIQLKDKKTGKTSAMDMTPDQMLRMGNAWNPQKLFEQEKATLDAAIAARAKRAEKVLDGELKEGQDIRSDARQYQYKLGELKVKSQIERGDKQFESGLRVTEEGSKITARSNAITGILRGLGYSDSELKAMGPQILKMHDSYKLTTSPSERASIMLSKDPRFSRLPADQQRAKLQEAVEMFKQLDASDGPANGLPAPSSATGGALIYDPATGQMR